MTGLKSENCGAGASEAKPEKPKMKLRFNSKLIFTLFSGAVLIVSVALIGCTSQASSQCNNTISTPTAKGDVSNGKGTYRPMPMHGAYAQLGYLNMGGSMFQDVYKVGGQSMQPNTQYTLSFWAIGGGSGVKRAIIEWHGKDSSNVPRTVTKEISISYTNWYHYQETHKPTDIGPPFLASVEYVRITYDVTPGGYAYISSTAFG